MLDVLLKSIKSLNNSKLLKSGVTKDQKNKLLDFVYLKTIVAEFMWFFLTGLLTTSASYNFIINSACSHSLKDMKERHDEYKNRLIQLGENPKTIFNYGGLGADSIKKTKYYLRKGKTIYERRGNFRNRKKRSFCFRF